MDAKGEVVKNFLKAPDDRFAILHLKDSEEVGRYRFLGTDALTALKEYDRIVKPENYELVYMADFARFPELPVRNKSYLFLLEKIFEKFNVDHPEDYKVHSLSVSDIVILHINGVNSLYYVDNFGHTELPDFLRELEA